MAYTLKKNQPPFEVVDGPMARRKFARGVTYEQIPKGEEHRFDKVKLPPAKPRTDKGGKP